ncbi:hypothetical protein GWN42_18225 [candidate division KSB1 bacterium]|nr:hypothetical protein [candidate division KSB1 bacterium]
MEIVHSINRVPIRLTEERWQHIISRHPELSGERIRLLETVSDPDLILEGDAGTLLGIRFYQQTNITSKHLITVYKETGQRDGFVLTAYFASQFPKWRKVVWKK